MDTYLKLTEIYRHEHPCSVVDTSEAQDRECEHTTAVVASNYFQEFENSEDEETAEQVTQNLFEDGEISSDDSEALDEFQVIEDLQPYEEILEEEPYSTAYWLYEYAVWGLTTPFIRMYEALSTIFYDGKHPCKQAKYACVLQEIKNNIPRHIKELVLTEPHCLTPMQKYLQKIVRLLSEPDENFEDGKRSRHRSFLKLYREALNSDQYNLANSDDVDDIHAIANAVYNVRLHSFIASVICGVIKKGSDSDDYSDIMDLSLSEQREAIRNLPQEDKAPLLVLYYNCAKGHFGIWFDPHLMGNIPHILFDLKCRTHVTRFIRTGTPTIDEKDPNTTLGFRTRIAPEFLAYLRYCRNQKRKLLYFNLQEAIGGAESYRSELLKTTFEEEGLANSIFMLDHGTRYYNQTGKWEGFNHAERFKLSLLDHLVRNPSFWIPLEFQNDPKFITRLKTMMDQIHEDVFFGEEILDQKERQDFLDIAYSHLILECIQYLEPDALIICCKDALDRSGVRAFILMYLVMLYTNRLSREDMLNLMVTTFGPPFLMKKQELIDERFERLNSCYIRLQHPRVKENLLARATSNGLHKTLNIVMHKLDEQVFNMDEKVFEQELDDIKT